MIVIAIALIVAVWLWPRVWSRLVHGRVHVSITVQRSHAAIGQSVPLTVTVRNSSWLPCPTIEVELDLPDGLAKDLDGHQRYIRLRTYLLMRQTVEFNVNCYAILRGRQWFAPKYVTVHLRDGLGLKEIHASQSMNGEVVVMPNFLSNTDSTAPVKEVVGKHEVLRWIYLDESLVKGSRQYAHGDPFKYIDWKASARSGKWMLKQYSSSTEASVELLLNAQGGDRYWYGIKPDEFDLFCSAIATWAKVLESKGVRSSFGTNAINPGLPKQHSYGELRSHDVRALLGRLTGASSCDFSAVLMSTYKKSSGRPIILITSYLTNEQIRIIRMMATAGYTLTIAIGPSWTKPVPKIPGVTWVPVSFSAGSEVSTRVDQKSEANI